MRATQKTIAGKLNLSQSLVAGVLNDKPGVWVSPANRERIRQAAREMGYRPNAAARRLRSGKSDSVGLVVTHPGGGLPMEFGDIVAALSRFLNPLGHDLTMKTFSEPAPALDGLAEIAQTHTCDVVVLWGTSATVGPQAALLADLKMPFVVIGSLEEPHPQWPQIDFDHLGLMQRSVAHLTALGHRRIAYLGHDNGEQYVSHLEAGFREAMRSLAGDPSPERWMRRLGPVRGPESEALMVGWLSSPAPECPTAAVMGASDDSSWRGLELALARLGRRLGEGPGEFAATGLHHTDSPLLFGHACGFSQTDLGHLMETLCVSLLTPLLRGEAPETNVLQVCPPMREMDSFDLLNYARFAQAAP